MMRILLEAEAKRIDIEFIYKRGDVLAITEKDFNQKFDIIPKGNQMGSTQVFAEKIDGMLRCPACQNLQKQLGVCTGCGKVLIQKKKC